MVKRKFQLLICFLLFLLPIVFSQNIASPAFNIDDITWTDPVVLNDDENTCTNPNIIGTSTNEMSVFWANRYGFNYRVEFQTISNSSEFVLQGTVPSTTGSEQCKVAIDELDIIHIAWRSSMEKLFYQYKEGEIWSSPEFIANLNYSTCYSISSIGNGKIVILWCNNYGSSCKLYAKLYNHNFDNWTDNILLLTADCYSLDFDLATDYTNTLHIIWSEMTDAYGYEYGSILKYSTLNSSLELADPIDIGTTGVFACGQPCITIDGSNNIHISWQERLESNVFRYIAYKERIDGIWSFVTYHHVDKKAGHPALYTDRDDITHLVWYEYNSIAYKKIHNITQISNQKIVGGNCDECEPDIFVDTESRIHIVYAGYETNIGKFYDAVYYVCGNSDINESPTSSTFSTLQIGYSSITTISLIMLSNILIVLKIGLQKRRKN